MIAFISDIHANLPALTAVFEDIDRLGTVERIYCLGDVVGYGPDPLACLDLTAARSTLILLGNHEHAVLHGAIGFHAGAKRAIDWTRAVIEAQPSPRRKALFDLLAHLPQRHEFGDVLLVHGSPRDPVMEYILESDLWEGAADSGKMDAVFAGFRHLCFVGHTHRPGVFTEDRCFLAAAEIGDGFRISDGRYLINVGSVGQPRDRDPRACYTLFSGDAVYFRRVAYDIGDAVRRILAVDALDPRFADRLQRGE